MRNFKLSFDNEKTQTYLDQDKGVIVCHLYGSMKDLDFVYDYDEFEGVGVARCKQGDDFNPEVGLKIATAKAESNAYRKARNYINKLKARRLFEIEQFNRFLEKGEGVIQHNEKYIHKMGGYVKNNR